MPDYYAEHDITVTYTRISVNFTNNKNYSTWLLVHRKIMAEAEMFSASKKKLHQNSRVGIKETDFFERTIQSRAPPIHQTMTKKKEFIQF